MDFYKKFKNYTNLNPPKYRNIHKNTTLQFLGTDTKDLWEKNKNIKNEKTVDYYKKNNLLYSFNNFGYRTPYNFVKNQEVNVYLGCSHTFGIGHLLENTWPYLLNKEIGGNLVNLSYGGVGIENQFKELIFWYDFFKIKNIFHYQPFYFREDILTENFTKTIHTADLLKDSDNNLLVEGLSSEPYLLRKYITNILAIENLANKINANYYFCGDEYNEPSEIQARDFKHMGLQSQIKIKDIFIEKINTNNFSINMDLINTI